MAKKLEKVVCKDCVVDRRIMTLEEWRKGIITTDACTHGGVMPWTPMCFFCGEAKGVWRECILPVKLQTIERDILDAVGL